MAGENDIQAALLLLLPVLPGPNEMVGWVEENQANHFVYKIPINSMGILQMGAVVLTLCKRTHILKVYYCKITLKSVQCTMGNVGKGQYSS